MKIRVDEPLEKQIQKDICEYLDHSGYFFWRQNNIPVFGRNNGGSMTFRSMPKYTPKGIPDIIVIHDGHFIGLEVKRKGAKLRIEQEIFRDSIEKNGGDYYVVHSVEETIQVMGMYAI